MCYSKSFNSRVSTIKVNQVTFYAASAFFAAIDKGQAFNDPKEFAVCLELTPKQHAYGNISKMGGTERGDQYLSKQLEHSARVLVNLTAKSTAPLIFGPPSFTSLNRLTKWPARIA
jgi:hypothetical protein